MSRVQHFDYLSADDADRLFLHPPESFSADDDPAVLGNALGATLYCPATRPALANDILRRSRQGVLSVVVCLEDSVPDRELLAAERNAIEQLCELERSGAPLPLIFIRVRTPEQIPMLVHELGAHLRVLAGFVVPKCTEANGAGYLEAVVRAGERAGQRLLVMPVLESPETAHAETRTQSLLAARRLVDVHRDVVPAVRVGATDLSGVYGLRRPRDFTVWNVRVVADALSAIVNVFARAGATNYVVTGPVWEYYASAERLFKPQLRESPFAEHSERALRAELLARDLDGLIREIVLDRANGLMGKTVIHPTHVAAVHALSVVGHEDFADASDVVATNSGGGASASSFGNKMNESKPHTAWAQRTLTRARVFGVAREGTSFVDQLGVGLHQ